MASAIVLQPRVHITGFEAVRINDSPLIPTEFYDCNHTKIIAYINGNPWLKSSVTPGTKEYYFCILCGIDRLDSIDRAIKNNPWTCGREECYSKVSSIIQIIPPNHLYLTTKPEIKIKKQKVCIEKTAPKETFVRFVTVYNAPQNDDSLSKEKKNVAFNLESLPIGSRLDKIMELIKEYSGKDQSMIAFLKEYKTRYEKLVEILYPNVTSL